VVCWSSTDWLLAAATDGWHEPPPYNTRIIEHLSRRGVVQEVMCHASTFGQAESAGIDIAQHLLKSSCVWLAHHSTWWSSKRIRQLQKCRTLMRQSAGKLCLAMKIVHVTRWGRAQVWKQQRRWPRP